MNRKTDRDDTLESARLSALNQLPTVWIPVRRVRQWRSLINYWHELVSRRTAIRNSIRSTLDALGYRMAMGARAWTEVGIASLRSLARPAMDCEPDGLWKSQLEMELTLLEALGRQINLIESKLDSLAAQEPRTSRLRAIPGVGSRLSETVVAWIDDPHRFRNARAVGSYVGLVPRRRQSGTYDRSGKVTKPGLLRKSLVEVA